MNTLSSNLRRLRRERKASQQAIADFLGITRQAYSNYEFGKRQPDNETLLMLAEYYHVSVDSLLNGDGNSAFVSPSESLTLGAIELAKRFDALDEHGQDMVLRVVDGEEARMQRESETAAEVVPIAKKTIPLLHDVAAGPTDISGEIEDEYEVDADSPAYLAIQISGDSMEPFLPDGSVQLVCYEKLSIGDIGVFMLDGGLLCKQYVRDNFGNVYLNSLNHDRADASVMISTSGNRTLTCYGKIICDPIPVQ